MAIIMGPNGITFDDGSSQTTKFDSTVDTGSLVNITTYTAAGSYTWTKPAGCARILVKVVGGGGGAAGYCESGGAGGYSEKYIEASAITSVAVTVGAGGAAVGYYAAAGNGGTSSFGAYATATGGYGANQNASHTGGIGGTGASGDVNIVGGVGTGHTDGAGGGALGQGGTSYFGSGRGVRHDSNNVPPGNSAPGAGGPGGRTDVLWQGGPGEPGAVIVYAFS
jgi:hypothetical protein